MNKLAKSTAALVLAGAMCAGLAVAAGCNKVGGEGKSAYDIAVENGFEGTEAEWLESLKEEVTVQTTIESYTVSYSVNENGERVATFVFKMSVGTTQTKTEILPVSVVDVSLSGNYSHIIWTDDEIDSEEYNLAGLNWRVTYDNGYSEYLPVTKDQILEVLTQEEYYGAQNYNGAYYYEGVYRVSVIFNKIWGEVETFEVLAVEDLDEFNETYEAETDVNQFGYYCRKGETFGLNNIYVAYDYNDVTVSEYYDGEPTSERYVYARRYQAVTEDMLDKAIDTSETGTYFYNVTIGEGTDAIKGNAYLTVYDKSVTNVESAQLSDYETITLQQNDTEVTIETEAAKLVGKTLSVYLFERENGSREKKVKITADMIDYSSVNQAVPGNYFLNINYGGYAAKVSVVVSPDMSEAELEYTLNGAGYTALTMMGGMVISEIKLYDNGYAELSANEQSLTEMVGYFGYTLENGALTLTYNGDKFAIFTADTSEGTFESYDFTELTENGVYTLNAGTEEVEIKTYDNGFATMDMQGTLMVTGFKLENDIMTFPIVDTMCEFEVGENNVLNMIMKN